MTSEFPDFSAPRTSSVPFVVPPPESQRAAVRLHLPEVHWVDLNGEDHPELASLVYEMCNGLESAALALSLYPRMWEIGGHAARSAGGWGMPTEIVWDGLQFTRWEARRLSALHG